MLICVCVWRDRERREKKMEGKIKITLKKHFVGMSFKGNLFKKALGRTCEVKTMNY